MSEKSTNARLVKSLRIAADLVDDRRASGETQIPGLANLIREAADTIERLEERLAAIRAELGQSDEPLTLDDLKSMRWQPVYIEIKETYNKASPLIHGQWAVISAIEGGCITFTDGEYCNLGDYGQTWLAYRRKPEQED